MLLLGKKQIFLKFFIQLRKYRQKLLGCKPMEEMKSFDYKFSIKQTTGFIKMLSENFTNTAH